MIDLSAKLHHGYTQKSLHDLRYVTCLERSAVAIGSPQAASTLPLGGMTADALSSGSFASLSLDAMLNASETKHRRVCVLGMGCAGPWKGVGVPC